MAPRKANKNVEKKLTETVLLPNDERMLEGSPIPWSHLFELARFYQAFSAEEQAKIKLSSWVEAARKVANPAELPEQLFAAGSKRSGKIDRLARIAGPLKELFKRAQPKKTPEEEEEHTLADIQKLIGCSINLDLSKRTDNSPLAFIPRLNPPAFCKPNQLNRSYGAHRFIHLKLSDQLSSRLRPRASNRTALQKSFREFIHAPIRIGNRLFYFFLRKENCLWFVASEEPGWESTKVFINELLDLKINKDMTVAKWAARTSLLLSATQSSIDIDPEDIRRVPDLYSDSLVISKDLLSSVADTLGLSYLPSCIEGSIRNQAFVWRLGPPSKDEKIQLWEDQLGKASKHVFIKFRARPYEFHQKRFVLQEESFTILLDQCLSMGPRPPGKSEIMTDGAGIISRAAATRVCESLGRKYDTLPSAYQARIGFSKGLWVVPPEYSAHNITPWIEIRDSQWKAEPIEGYTFHFNLCRISRSVTSSSLGKQLLPVLSARGVQNKTVCSALEEHITSTISDLNSSDPLRLAEVLSRSGGLKQTRRAILDRISNVQHNPTAYRTYGNDPVAPNIDPEYGESWAFTTDGLHAMSLVPFHAEEQVISMLAAGFEPRNRYIVTKLRKIKEDKISNAIKFRVPIAQSTYLYVMPDPTGTLKEDEAFLQFSSFEDYQTGIKLSNLVCPAIVSRSPCVASIDARKINLVDNDILRDVYYDVLVCSIQGKTSLLSLLSGGDYDGDQVMVIWDPVLVQQFHNVDLDKHPRIVTDELFEPVQLGTVEECLLEAYENNPEEFVKTAQLIQAAGLFTPNDAGSYSIKHTMAEYLFGLDNPLTQKLGEVYVKCLDAPKAGTQLKAEADLLLKKEYEAALDKVTFPNGKKIIHFPVKSYPIPKYLSGDPKFSFNGAARAIRFEFGGKPHILDEILKMGYALLKTYKEELDSKDIVTHQERFHDRDEDLSQFFLERKRFYEFNRSEPGACEIWIGILRPLQRAIRNIASEWGKAIAEGANAHVRDKIWESEYGPGTGGSGKNSKHAYDVQKKYDELSYSKAFEYQPGPEEMELYKFDLDEFKLTIDLYLQGLGPTGYALLKASCLAMCCNPESFCPYDIAFREICHLKTLARQKKTHLTSTGETDMIDIRAPKSIVTTSYLTNVVKQGTLLGRSKPQAHSDPV
ncbi:hypothetical protein PGT21_002642 [Puccinia graminis f. sp. tritici]|uniref:RNA-dependent RNA polymerase n=1 Tax=Puccinia graminis f. sp. tritici TaxID=56615 RepID=A0A5B0PFZ3_PUCGR|nr:hypothetical protein PGT21_002642 [Puccinia graminis f. sp. tritici]